MPIVVTEFCSGSVTTGPEPRDVFCVAFSDDGSHISCGTSDGHIFTLSAATGKVNYTINPGAATESATFPVTCIRYRPYNESTKTRNVLLATNSSGLVQHWHVTSGKCIHQISEQPNQTYVCDYRADGMQFATAGQDYTVRVYDESTKSLTASLIGGHGDVTAGHSSRVFSLKFVPEDPNLLITGGWDNTIQIWDVRLPHAVRSIFGPHIAGDAVDVLHGQVVSGSWRSDNQLQLWDFASGQLIKTYNLPNTGIRPEPLHMYAAEFSPDGTLIACCGSGSNEAKVLEKDTGAVLLSVSNPDNAYYCCGFSPDGSKVAFSGHGGVVSIYEIRNVARR